MLQTLNATKWDESFPENLQQNFIQQLESGDVLFFPSLAFTLSPDEQKFLSPHYVDPQAKNISYLGKSNRLWGVRHLSDKEHIQLKNMLDRFSRHAISLVKSTLPKYAPHLLIARTSFRPVQVSDRVTSYRKDDRRLHVDAFPSAPNQGNRILRVFCNINPNNEDRVWRIGEPFEQVANRFIPQISPPFPGNAALLRFLRITKSYRTLYDHYMLRLHDKMKSDDDYQKHATQQEVRFPSGSTWIVQTDDVSHAAMKGQHMMEQTFYLPVSAMQDESRAPLRVLEKILGRKLV